jgi:phosphoglycolate phosphatase-like HAD superfamily hydrolase
VTLDNYSLIFLDFDGVIKESVEIKTRAFVELFMAYGQDVASKVKKHHMENGGMSRFDKMPIYLKWAGINVDNNSVEFFSKQFGRLVVQGVIDSPWVPGVKDYLYCNSNLQKFVLVSATPKDEIDYILKILEIDSQFERVYGSPTKKYNAINTVLSEMDIALDKCLMIGDAYSDQQAASANNIDFLLRIHLSNEKIFQNYQGKFIKDFSLL